MTLPDPNGNVIDQQTGGGCAYLIGLPFFLAGLGVIVITFIPPETRGGDPISLYFGIPFGSLFALIGGAILFGRMNLTIDRNTGLIRKQWKAFGIIARNQEAEIKAYDKISVTSEIRRSKNSTYTVYPIRLLGPDVKKFDISQSRNELEARKETEVLSKFLSLPIHDEISGKTRIREADSLDQSVKEKFKTGATTNEIPEPPAKLKSNVHYDGTTLQVDVPPLGFNIGFVMAIIFIGVFEAVFITVFAIPMFSNLNSDSPDAFLFPIFALFFLSIPTFILVALIGNAFFAKQSVIVSNQSLQVIRGWPFKKTVNIPAQELEELFISKNKRNGSSTITGSKREIIAISDSKQTSFGTGLDNEELNYLLALAKGIIVS